MPIPTIPPYPMPTAESLPESAVGWRPDPARAALLIHDMQQYFLQPFQGDRSPRLELERNVGRLRDVAAETGLPVVYTAQPGGMTTAQRGLLRDFWGQGMNGDDDERRILATLAPRRDDTVLTKWRYSAFHETGLRDRLAALGRDQLIVSGVFANTGCLVTAVDAFSHDVETFLVHDALADFSESEHRQALRYAAARCAAIPSTERVLADLEVAETTAASVVTGA